LEKREKQVLPGSKEVEEEVGGGGQGGEMAQTMYMNICIFI
jgi:hypothetical protein